MVLSGIRIVVRFVGLELEQRTVRRMRRPGFEPGLPAVSEYQSPLEVGSSLEPSIASDGA